MKNIFRALLISTILLLIPLTASFFVEGWLWTVSDYVFAWILFSLLSLTFTFITRSTRSNAYKAAAALAIVGAFLLVWINAAVGIIHNDNGSNLLYFLALLIGFIVAFLNRFEPQGMTRALFTLSILIFLIPLASLFIWSEDMSAKPHGIVGVFILNSIFGGLFLLSTFLFRQVREKA